MDHRGLLIFGLVFGGMGVLALLIDEWLYGPLHPFDFKGRRESPEPIKRVAFHLFYIAGLASLVAWCAWEAGAAIVGLF
jgi:hypothetical protein